MHTIFYKIVPFLLDPFSSSATQKRREEIDKRYEDLEKEDSALALKQDAIVDYLDKCLKKQTEFHKLASQYYLFMIIDPMAHKHIEDINIAAKKIQDIVNEYSIKLDSVCHKRSLIHSEQSQLLSTYKYLKKIS